MRTFRATTIAAAAAGLLLVGCGGDEAIGQLTDAFSEAAEDDAADEETDAEPVESDETDETDETDGSDTGETDDAGASEQPAADVTTVDGRTIDETVHYAGLEYTVAGMTAVDLDAEASPDGQVDNRVRGIELTFDVSVFNPGNDTVMPSPPISLRWDETGTGNVVDVSGRAEFRQVPGDSSSSGEIVVTVPPADLEVYDDASARLILGQSGHSAAQVPVGSDAEIITRFPVQQPFVGESFNVSGVEVTITAAEVRWDYTGNSHLEDGQALLELTYTMDNQSDSQSCSTRGQGAFALTLPSGDGIVDEGVTERCVSGGEAETDVRTGFLIDGDYAGDYTLRHERGGEQDEITFTLVAEEGVPSSERTTR